MKNAAEIAKPKPSDRNEDYIRRAMAVPRLEQRMEMRLGRRIRAAEDEMIRVALSCSRKLVLDEFVARARALVAGEFRARELIERNIATEEARDEVQAALAKIRVLRRDPRHNERIVRVVLALTPSRRLMRQLVEALMTDLRGGPTTPESQAVLQKLGGPSARAAEARNQLVESHLGLVVALSRRYLGRRTPVMDLIQEGNAGLVHAAEKYDPWRRERFATYAGFWIRQGMSRATIADTPEIRVSNSLHFKLRKMERVSERLMTSGDAEVARALEIDVAKLKKLRQVRHPVISLDTPIGDKQVSTIRDVIADESSPAPDEALGARDVVRQVNRLIETLRPRERDVVAMRYGVGGGAPRTLAEVGQALSVSKERVRQIEVGALARLRHPSRRPMTEALRESLNV